MTRCRSGDGCAADATMSIKGDAPLWCRTHGEQLAAVAAAITRPANTGTKKTQPLKELDEQNALKLASVVWLQDVPVTGLAQRAGLHYGSDAYKTALALAQERGWIASDGGAFAKGDEPPGAKSTQPKRAKRERATELARAVHAAGKLSKAKGAAAAGVKPSALTRISAYAVEQGWIEVKFGGSAAGYVPGRVEPPTAAPPVPPTERALALAKVVHANGGKPLPSTAAAAEIGVAGGALARAARVARDAGWVETKRGPRGGYIPGPTPLPG